MEGDQPRPGAGRRGRGHRGRRRREREDRSHAAPDRPDQRPPAREPAGGARRVRMAEGRRAGYQDGFRRRIQCRTAPARRRGRSRRLGGGPGSSSPGVQRSGLATARSSRSNGPARKDAAIGDPIEVYVPPGESRVVRVPRPAGTASPTSLVLKGDAAAFDNTLYVADENEGGGDRPLPRRRSARRPRRICSTM